MGGAGRRRRGQCPLLRRGMASFSASRDSERASEIGRNRRLQVEGEDKKKGAWNLGVHAGRKGGREGLSGE